MSEQGKPPRRMQDRAVRTRARIMDAAGQLFETCGYGGTTINAIVDKAGIAKGAFYHHFKDKNELASTILEETLDLQAMEEQDCKLQEIYDTGMILAYRIIHEPPIRAALRLSLEYNARDTYGTPWPPWISIDTEQLEAAIRNGEVAPDIDTTATSYLIAGGWAGIVVINFAVNGNLDDLEERISLMYKNLFLAIAHPRYLRQLDLSPDRGKCLYEEFLAKKQTEENES